MAKNKNKGFNVLEFVKKGNLYAYVTDQLNSKNIIKGDKKVRKRIGALCFHHKITKKGKLVPMIGTDKDGQKCCIMCGGTFDVDMASKKEVKQSMEKLQEYLDQIKFVAASTDCDEKTRTFLATMNSFMVEFPNVYDNIAEVAKRVDNNKKGGKKKNNKYNSFGMWSGK